MQDLPAPTSPPPPAPGAPGPPRWLFATIVATVAAVMVLAAVALALLTRDDSATVADTTTSSEPGPTTTAATSTSAPSTPTSAPTSSEPSSTTTTESSTTTSQPTSTSSVPSTIPQPPTAVWPWADSSLRYDDPVEAARGFATDFLGFHEPVVGDYLAGDSRSGEVEIRPTDDGPVTTVLVRQLTADDSWWVLGSVAEDVVVEEPDALAAIDDPVPVSGQGRAFEGVIEVQVRADGRPAPLGTGFVIASGDEELRPFEGTIEFDEPPASAGAIVFLTRSAEDGAVWEASVVRIAFAS